MNLLITTQKVDIDDDVLGFFHGWLLEFAKHCESLTVICLYEGRHELPANVRVLSLGKESGRSRWKYLWRFYGHIFRERFGYDSVFVHMNPEYVVLGGLFWRMLGKKVFLWYLHRAVNAKLRLAEILASVVFTASPESFGIPSRKLQVVGHGIDCQRFLPGRPALPFSPEGFRLLCVGRISPIKNQKMLVEAMAILRDKHGRSGVKLDIVGASARESDSSYLQAVKDLADSLGLSESIRFVGSVPNQGIAPFYAGSDLSINLCPTGGMDKVVLESWASSLPCLLRNKTFSPYLANYPEYIFDSDDPEALAARIDSIIGMRSERYRQSAEAFRLAVEEKHSLSALISRLAAAMS
jgi:glycosyltransferase involved in cell wall biosynthesis